MAPDVAAWIIVDFDEGPHYDTAIIVAPTADAACDILEAKIDPPDEDDKPDGVWHVQPRDKWTIKPWSGVFILGSGCR